MTTKSEYIAAHPRSMLADALRETEWPDDTPVEIIGGLIAPDNPRSNLAVALARSVRHEYVVGGHRWRGPDGWWMAVA